MNKRLLGNIENPRLSPAYFEVIRHALKKAMLYGDTVVIALRSVPYPDAVAEVADFFMRLETAKWTLCLGPHEGFLHVSLRTTDPNATAGRLLASVLPSGMAGGHGMIAGGKVKINRGMTKGLSRQITVDILRAMGKDEVRPRSLANLKEALQEI